MSYSTPTPSTPTPSLGKIVGASATIIVAILLLIGLFVGAAFGCQSYTRYQKRANAHNQVKVTAIQIQNQAQRVQIAKQQADIRYQRAIGIKKAQDEIQKTLTPLYVQFEMVSALEDIAVSGHNNSLVYIPVGANGIPLISNATGQVGPPTSGGK